MQRILFRLIAAAGLLALPGFAAAASPQLKITVYGGTGNIGQRIVAEGLSRGHQVTVVARRPEELKLQGTGLAVAKGDVTETAEATRLVKGQDVVISAINVGRGTGFEGDDFLRRAAQSLVTAVRAAGPKGPRLIIVGGASTLETSPGVTVNEMQRREAAGAAAPPSAGGPSAPGQVGAAVQQQQVLDYLRGVKDVRWTYLSPSMQITPGTRTGKFRLGRDQLLKDASGTSRISMEDYAVAMIDEAERALHVRQRFTVGY